MAQSWFRSWRRPRAARATRTNPPGDRRLRLEALESRWVPSNSIPLNTTSWTAVGPAPITGGGGPYSGRINDVAVDPTNFNTVYVAASGGGIWKTTNASAANPSWAPLTDSVATAMGAVAVAPSNPNVVYAGTGDGDAGDAYGIGVLKSTDAGATWTVLGQAQFGHRTIRRILVSPTDPNTVFVSVAQFANGDPGDNRGVWRSTDGGLTWTNLTASIATTDPVYDMEFAPGDPNTLYVAFGSVGGDPANGIYKSVNALSASPTFTLLSTTLPTGVSAGRFEIGIGGTPATANTLFVTVSDVGGNFGALKGIFKSTDAGATWTDLTTSTGMTNYLGGQGWYDSTVAIDPANVNDVIVGGATQELRSTD